MSWLHHFFLPRESNNQRAKILHPSTLSLVIVFFIIFQILLSKATIIFPQTLGYASQILPNDIIRLTNIERQNKGLTTLTYNQLLSQAAAQKAADMFINDYWAHVSPSGTQPWVFITQSGYSYRYAGENLARDFSDSAGVVRGWMNSVTHKDNLLNPQYSDIGVAVVNGKLGGRETTLVVQMFGAPLKADPIVSASSTSTSVVAASLVTQKKNLITPFSLTKIVSITTFSILALVFFIDVLIINKRKIYRWTSKSFAHFIFVVIMLVAALSLIRGQIL